MSNEYKPTYVDNTDNSISIMESTDTISFCKTGTKINTLSAKNVAHKKSGEDLNLCAYDGSSFNPVLTINNQHNDCRIMTNLNVNGNVNINNNLIIPTHSETSTLLSNVQGSIYFNTTEKMYEGYVSVSEGWQPLGGFSKTKDATIHKNLNVSGNLNIIGNGIINTSLGIGTTSLNNGFTSSNVHTNSILDINGQTTIRGHILPSQNAQFDLGNAEYKIRHLFLSDNSLWIGDEHKIDISNGKMKFKKIKKASDFIPTGLTNNAVLQTAISNRGGSRENYTINDWNIIANEVGVSNLNQVFKSDNSNNWAEDKEEGAGVVPIGGIIMWSGTAVPPGWALCDGNNGTPDLKGRFIVGAGGASGTIHSTGGENSVTLTEAQMPWHNHSITVDLESHNHSASTGDAGAHNHNIANANIYGRPDGWTDDGGHYWNHNWAGSQTTDQEPDHSHTVTVNHDSHRHTASADYAGSGLAHENRPPFYALAYIIRIQ